jgi:hypothetical protein
VATKDELSRTADYYEKRSAELGFTFTESHARLEEVVDRLQRRWGPKPPEAPKPKLTLIQGGRDA